MSETDAESEIELLHDVLKLRKSFESRYKSLSQLKNRTHQTKAAKRAFLDLDKICKKYEFKFKKTLN